MQGVLHKLSAFIGPAVFSLPNGHFRSALLGRPVNFKGEPIPWYTYPAVDFLNQLDFEGCSILEFGPGNSTLWWSKKAKDVTSIEANPDWYERLSQWTAGVSNVSLHLLSDPDESEQMLNGRTFHVIVVDGGNHNRPRHAETAFRLVKPTGLVIVDNANNGYSGDGKFPIIEKANKAGFMRIDFIGQVAGGVRPSCTSFFFKPDVNLFSTLPPAKVSLLRR